MKIVLQQTGTCLRSSSVFCSMVLALPGRGASLRKSLSNITALTWGACKAASWCHEPGVLAVLLKAGPRRIVRGVQVALPGQVSKCKSQKSDRCSSETTHKIWPCYPLSELCPGPLKRTLCVPGPASGLGLQRGNNRVFIPMLNSQWGCIWVKKL